MVVMRGQSGPESPKNLEGLARQWRILKEAPGYLNTFHTFSHPLILVHAVFANTCSYIFAHVRTVRIDSYRFVGLSGFSWRRVSAAERISGVLVVVLDGPRSPKKVTRRFLEGPTPHVFVKEPFDKKLWVYPRIS